MPHAIARLLTSEADPLFWPALEFYVESFPRDEREALSRVAKVAAGNPELCDGPVHRVHMAVADVDGRLGGIRYFSYDARAKLGFFIYLAVEPEFRKHGIGTQLVVYGKQVCLRDAEEMKSTLEAIFFECERPELAETPDERKVRDDRIQYFLNRGAVIVSKDYYQPALGPDREAVPLWLLAYPMSDEPAYDGLIRDFHRLMLGYPADSIEERRCLSEFSRTQF